IVARLARRREATRRTGSVLIGHTDDAMLAGRAVPAQRLLVFHAAGVGRIHSVAVTGGSRRVPQRSRESGGLRRGERLGLAARLALAAVGFVTALGDAIHAICGLGLGHGRSPCLSLRGRLLGWPRLPSAGDVPALVRG